MAQANRVLVRAGFLLFCLALVTGFAIPVFLNTKMALAAHVTGVLNALILIALGLAWGMLALTPTQKKITTWLFIAATYANWGGSCLAAAWGTSRLTPIGANGFTAEPWKETVVQAIQVSLALAILVGGVLVVHGLRSSGSEAQSA